MKLLFISLGCDKNLVDSEMMMGLLHDRGYEFTDNEEEADIIVINTCGFINDAKEESINTILEMAKYKENNLKALIVAGCLVERYKNEILQELPEIDAIVGVSIISFLSLSLQVPTSKISAFNFINSFLNSFEFADLQFISCIFLFFIRVTS